MRRYMWGRVRGGRPSKLGLLELYVQYLELVPCSVVQLRSCTLVGIAAEMCEKAGSWTALSRLTRAGRTPGGYRRPHTVAGTQSQTHLAMNAS